MVLVGIVAYAATRPAARLPVAKLPTGPPQLLAPGTVAPDFSLPRLGGGPPVVLSSYRGTPVVLNFFASWCPHCRPELAPLGALARAEGGRVAVVGVDSNDLHPALASQALAAAGAAYPVAVDAQAQLAARYLLDRASRDVFPRRPGPGGGRAHGPRGRGCADAMGGPPDLGHGRPVTTDVDGHGSPRAPAPRVDRAAALAAGTPRLPRRTIYIGAAVLAILALGGVGLENLFSNVGLNPTATPTATTVPALRASTASFLGVVRLTPAPAPAFSLVGQAGATVRLGDLLGKAVVLSFFDADCADACPVLAADIRQADVDLGADRARVAFVTVNADPLAPAGPATPAAVSTTGLAALGNWQFLTGPVPALDAVWRSYGVSIKAWADTGTVVHNNVMYFVDPSGRLRIRATPVADESTAGTWSLPAASIRRSAQGIASYAAGLLDEGP